MNRRYSQLIGDLPPSDVAGAGGDQLELRAMLSAEQARSEAAERRCADLLQRLDAAEQRNIRLEADLQQANARIADLSQTFAAAQSHHQESANPLAYEGYISMRDGEGRIKKFDLVPKPQQ